MYSMGADQLPIPIVGSLRHVCLDMLHIVGELGRVLDAQSDVRVWQTAVLKLHRAKIVSAATIPALNMLDEIRELQLEDTSH